MLSQTRLHAAGSSMLLSPTFNAGRAAVRLCQDETPLVDALVDAARSVRAPFFFPGHKMGMGAPARLRRRLLGAKALRHDLPELPELDNLFAPEGPILEAERLAAKAFGASHSWLLINGSTGGVLAAVLACVQLWAQRRGTTEPPVVLLPRNAHKSAVHALVLSGATVRR